MDPTSLNPHPFDQLTPEFIMDAVEQHGFLCDGRNLALNSYENRVYQIGLEDEQGNSLTPIIAKFYRPNRWTRDQILEEHTFCFELAEQELPVVTPLLIEGSTLFEHNGFLFSLFPRQGGHAPELDNFDSLLTLGRLLGRMHRIGSSKPFEHRPALTIETYGTESVEFISEHLIPTELKTSYDTLTRDLLDKIEKSLNQFDSIQWIRTHGDCHIGNILWRDDNAHFVDFDDCRMAPAIQDIWMMLSGDRANQTAQLYEIIEGYEEFNEFDPIELNLIETLRTLRMMHYCAWLARRWDDPAFPMHFPWFNTERYWGEHILELREQMAALDEPVLKLTP